MHMSLHRRCLPKQDSFRGSQMDADLFLGFKDELGNRVELQAQTPPGSIQYDCLNADHRVLELAVALSGTGPQWLAQAPEELSGCIGPGARTGLGCGTEAGERRR